MPYGAAHGSSGGIVNWDDDFEMHVGDPNTNGDKLDGLWVTIGEIPIMGTPRRDGGWWDMGRQTDKVVVFLSQDHGPYLGEGLEYQLYGSNTLWERRGAHTIVPTLTKVYLDGWRPHNHAEDINGNGWCSDDIGAVWVFPEKVRYVVLYAWTEEVSPYMEPEVDAICTEGVTLTMKVDGCGSTIPEDGKTHIYFTGELPDNEVNITATPCNENWEFCGWEGDVADINANPTTVTMDSDKTVTAKFCPLQRTLTMKVEGCGGTTVPPVGSKDYDHGTTVEISAQADEGCFFTGWTGDVPDPFATTVVMDSDKTVIANFDEIPPVYLTVETEGCVEYTEPPVGTTPHQPDTVVQISASCCPGQEFVGWTGDVTGPNATTVTMDTDKTIVANCEPVEYKLTVKKEECGDSTTRPSSPGTYTHWYGDVVEISAYPDEGCFFTGWTGDVTDPFAETVIIDSDKTITAHFESLKKLTIKVTGCGLTDPCMGEYWYTPNTIVPISALPCAQWILDNWTGGVNDPNSPSTTVTMDSDKVIVANFSPKPVIPLDMQLAVVIDGSSSIDSVEWSMQKDGLYNSIVSGTIPHDGSVELTVLQFAGEVVETEVPPTIITENNWASIASDIDSIFKINGVTPISVAIERAKDEIIGSPNRAFASTAEQVINISSDIGEYTIVTGFEAAVVARNNAIQAGIDRVLAEGIGDIRSVDMEWLKNNIVYPEPGVIAPPFNTGWVMKVDSAVEFETAMASKFKRGGEEGGFILAICSSEGGSVTEPGEGFFPENLPGSVVDLVATPQPGWRFMRWDGSVADLFAKETTITMNRDETVTAHFGRFFNLYIESSEGGSVIIPGEGAFTYEAGRIIELVALADAGWVFNGWTGNVRDPLEETTKITMDQNKWVTANFVKEYSLDIGSTGGGSVTVPGEGTFYHKQDEVVELEATADVGWAFDRWTGDVDDPNVPATSIKMTENKSVEAHFIRAYTLTVSSSEGGRVMKPGEGTYEYRAGEVVDLVATKDEGYAFSQWTGDVSDRYSHITTITMDEDKTVKANFIDRFTLTMDVSGGGSTTPEKGKHEFPVGEIVDIAASADKGWMFIYWAGDVADIFVEDTTVTMDANNTVKAYFLEVPGGVDPQDVTRKRLVMEVIGAGTTIPSVGAYLYSQGHRVEIMANPNSGWKFDNWSSNVDQPELAVTTVTMNTHRLVTAYFSSAVATPTPTPPPPLPPTHMPTTSPAVTPTTSPMPTPVITPPPTQPTPTPTPTPEKEPAEVPWGLIFATIAAVLGLGVLFYVLRKRQPG
jgi:hypothetical protein